MNTSKRQSKRKRLFWIWMLVISMVAPLLPVQQTTVQAAEYFPMYIPEEDVVLIY